MTEKRKAVLRKMLEEDDEYRREWGDGKDITIDEALQKIDEYEKSLDTNDEQDFTYEEDPEYINKVKQAEKEAENFAADLYDIIQGILNDNAEKEVDIDENFGTAESAQYHFDRHCVGPDSKGIIHPCIPYDVRYSFKTLDSYLDYENKMCGYITGGNGFYCYIPDKDTMKDRRYIESIFKDLLRKTNYSIIFGTDCGFYVPDHKDTVEVMFRNSGSRCTKLPSLDVFVHGTNTVTLFPIYYSELGHELNHIIFKYNRNTDELPYYSERNIASKY